MATAAKAARTHIAPKRPRGYEREADGQQAAGRPASKKREPYNKGDHIRMTQRAGTKNQGEALARPASMSDTSHW